MFTICGYNNNEKDIKGEILMDINENEFYQPYRQPEFNEQFGQPKEPEKNNKRKEKKKGMSAGKVIAVGIVCAMLGGLAGGGVSLLVNNSLNGKAQLGQSEVQQGDALGTTLLESIRENESVNIISINGLEELTVPEIYQNNVASAVGISVESQGMNFFGQITSTAASGSGFVITENGYIITNHHVIDDAQTIKVSFENGDSYDAELIGSDEDNDIAVIKIEASGLKPVVLGDSSQLNVGETVVAIGNPLGELTYTLTQGVVSALDRSITMSDGNMMNLLQTDCPINSGNSGGPLFNSFGELVGIVNAKYSSNSYSSASIENIGFAIPINDVKDMISDIIQYGYVTGKPYLGIRPTTISMNDALRYDLEQGVYVNSVVEGSSAEAAGLKKGDVIVAVDGKEVLSVSELAAVLKKHKAGDEIVITVYRDENKLELPTVLDEQKQNSAQNTSQNNIPLNPYGGGRN